MVDKRGYSVASSSSKAQVTVFIIIGIIILFTFVGVLLVTKTVIKERFLTEGEPLISRVPQAFVPLQLYVENCLNLVGKQGLLLIGQQGGYINPAVLGEFSASHPTASVGINLEPTKVPYWWHNQEVDSSNVISYTSLQPKLTGNGPLSIEKQLERHVQENLDRCLDDFTVLKQQGFTITVEEGKKVAVTIREKATGLTLNMNLAANFQGAEAELDTFYVTIPLELPHYYEVADSIKKTQEQHHFLEKQGLELLAVYSRKSPTALAPTSDVTLDYFSTLSWSESQLKQLYKEILTSYVPLLKFLGSNNFYFSQLPQGGVLSQRVLDNMVIPLTGAEDLSIRFDYLNWNPYFKTNSDGGTIRPNSQFVNYNFLQFASQQYETHYDISYPVLVTITDPTALNGDGYNFVLALEANIRNNAPAEGGIAEEKYSRSLTPLICKDNQRTTELIKTIVVDSFTKQPLEAVRVGFKIPEQAECEIGLTNQFGVVEEKYPAVYGGEVSFVRPDYLTNFYPIDTYKVKDKPLLLGYTVAGTTAGNRVIELDRRQTIPVTVKKKQFQKCLVPLECRYTVGTAATILPYRDIRCEEGVRQCFFNQGNSLLLSNPSIKILANNSLSRVHEYYFNPQAVDLDANEQVVITLERVSGFNSLTRQVEYTTSVAVSGRQSATVDLFPGIYKVTTAVTDQRELVIPADERCFQFDILTWETETCVNLDPVRLPNQNTGSLQWITPATYFEVTPEDLYTANVLTFYVPVQDWSSVPAAVSSKQQDCGSVVCLPSVGCAFEACRATTVPIPAKVIEELAVVSRISDLASTSEYRSVLEPRWT